jgi:hypothetical protein
LHKIESNFILIQNAPRRSLKIQLMNKVQTCSNLHMKKQVSNLDKNHVPNNGKRPQVQHYTQSADLILIPRTQPGTVDLLIGSTTIYLEQN